MLDSVMKIKNLDFNEKWVDCLYNTKKKTFNYERINSMKELTTKKVYEYVVRTLEILDSEKDKYSEEVVYYVDDALKWSEVSKCGNSTLRKDWKKKKVNLEIHNIGSSVVYQDMCDNYDEIVMILIKTHGLIGQTIRGECNFSENYELYKLIKDGKIDKDVLREVLVLLNKCVVGAVSMDLYQRIENKINNYIECILNGEFNNKLTVIERLSLLNHGLSIDDENVLRKVLSNREINDRLSYLFERLGLGYYESALGDFSIIEQVKILLIVSNYIDEDSKYLTVLDVMKLIYFDYDGKKEVNIYKKRIIENYIDSLEFDDILNNRISNNLHIKFDISKRDDVIVFNFKFSIQAIKLIEFCEVAYVSDVMYKKAVFMLYDLFGFRKDEYDRFYNEISYLSTMNKSVTKKAVILDYMVGKNILDVGPGGGALMDMILDRDDSLNVIGMDISNLVVNALNKKKKEEGKKWKVIYGNALDISNYISVGSVDTIIFSSIIHEIFSYSVYNGKKFNHDVIVRVLKQAYSVLPRGGRIIIRDGIESNPRDIYRIIEFKNVDDIEILNRYCGDFKGRKISYEKIDNNKVRMLINDAMEFLYTYTWGEDSYALEVCEQFGYYTLDEYLDVIKNNLDGVKIIDASSYLQEGYEKNLLSKISIYDDNMNVVKLPDSTCLIVIEKN